MHSAGVRCQKGALVQPSHQNKVHRHVSKLVIVQKQIQEKGAVGGVWHKEVRVASFPLLSDPHCLSACFSRLVPSSALQLQAYLPS